MEDRGEGRGKNALRSLLQEMESQCPGVDLNRNFQAFWEEYQDLKGQPSREGYKGRAPEDQEESKALAELTRQEKFQRTVSYHSSGEVIYWDFGQKGEFRKNMQKFWGADPEDHRVRPAGRLGLSGSCRLQGLGRKRKEDPQSHY